MCTSESLFEYYILEGVPVDEGSTLIVLEKGHLFGSKAIVVKRNKGDSERFTIINLVSILLLFLNFISY